MAKVSTSSTVLAERGVARTSASAPLPGARGVRAFFSPSALIDRAVGVVSPQRALRRAQYRNALAHYYDAVKQTRLRRVIFTNPSGDGTTYGNVLNLRSAARDLERNHDLARSVAGVLVRNTVGTGMGIEPQPRLKDGEYATDVAAQIRTLYRAWQHRPEVTREMSWAMTQRLAARRWFVDGEVLAQHVEGRVAGLKHSTTVPYSVELIEADQLSDWITDPERLIMQGVERNEWGMPIAYWIYHGNPGDLFIAPRSLEAKRILAHRITHLKLVDRIRQARGVSVFASVMTRLDDLKDYEESERIAAKVAASMAAVIIKGDAQSYQTSTLDNTDQDTQAREIKFRAGMVFDDLLPGEDVRTIDTKRPNAQLEAFRDGQMRAIAGGTETSASSISRKYDNNYSAQRQELIESYGAYGILSEHFAAQFAAPIYKRFVAAAVASGQLQLPSNIDMPTIDDALYLGPQMPWIDPMKEANAWTVLEEAGFASGPEIVRRRGQNPDDVLTQEKAWLQRKQDAGITPIPVKETIRARLLRRPAYARAQEHIEKEESRDGR